MREEEEKEEECRRGRWRKMSSDGGGHVAQPHQCPRRSRTKCLGGLGVTVGLLGLLAWEDQPPTLIRGGGG